MHRLALIGLSAVTLAHGQAKTDLLLQKAQSITGVVMDSSGKRISKVRIDHSDYISRPRMALETDVDGKFEIQTTAPALVLRKAGYRDYFLRTTGVSNIRVVLEPTKPFVVICSSNRSCQSITDWSAEFCFPRIPTVKTSRQGQDVDYGARVYRVKGRNGPVELLHGSGSTWTSGVPKDTDVWASVEYDGTMYTVGELPVIDARGRTAEGKRWRYVGRWGESASYRDADDAAARILDRVLDGMCFLRKKP